LVLSDIAASSDHSVRRINVYRECGFQASRRCNPKILWRFGV